MRRLTMVMVSVLLMLALTAMVSLAGYVCEYSNSEGTGNDATNRSIGIAVVSEDNFVMSINRDDQGYYAICKWTDASATAGRGNDVLQWFYNFDTVNLENPLGLASDGQGNVYVANNDPDHNILVFDGNLSDPAATQYRLATAGGDTICTIDVDQAGYVFVGYCNADQDRVDIYPAIADDMWTTHTGSPMATVPLPDGLYYGMCVNATGTEIYVSEYTSSVVTRYVGTVTGGYTLDTGFSVQMDSVATAVDVDNQGYLYVVSDHWRDRTYEYSKFWVVNLTTGAVTDIVDMYWEGGGDVYGASETSAGYYSAVDIEVDEGANAYVVHDYAWAVEKWTGSPSTGVDIIQGDAQLPRESILVQNYPNPFNASTEIHYRLPEDAHVRLEVFNVTGQLVDRLVDREQAAGQHLVNWNAANLPSGIYLARLQAGQEMAMSKMALVK
jgi:hypothetical protein